MFSGLLSLLTMYPFLTLRLTGRESSFPRPLSKAEEADCLRRLAEGDAAAREELISHNLRLVAHIVKKYYARAAEEDDLISIGTIGLIKGVESFDAAKGIRLATYASRCIENEILMHFRSARKTQNEVSLSDSAEGEGDGLTLEDTLAAPGDLMDEVGDEALYRRLRELVEETLSGREREIVTLRYGLGCPPLPQREVAERLGISRSYVSRLEKRALALLRRRIEKEELL
ncbi:MAG: sigma-70 family RNA polymerase sigma factor [bacterium]